MTGVPRNIDAAVEQAKEATRAAIQAGVPRILIELNIPELKGMPIAEQFYPVLQELGFQFKVYFPDAGAAALARRDWEEPEFSIRGINEVKGQLEPDDDACLIVEPSSVEVGTVEAFCNAATGKYVVMLNPKLEDIAIVGIGYAARQLRERFLSTLESCYYLQPQEGYTLLRIYPGSWQVWGEVDDDYELLGEFPTKPSGEAIAALFAEDATEGDSSDPETNRPRPQKRGLLSELGQFIRALTQ
ncbi:DUF1995 family protein [Oscillatoria sp. CS-180]|uniref:DUF1995 family protein n=1 Tax=Oscillatoria sp. CS-180 TaxID=3021720 RepID=UPI00232F7FAB|nr:DUF1995 family protein [Oscillatoria sp. CS-180]MDB9528391.1 DUF1995 family protein [Oscillatoria sp. CS-180]